MLPDSVILTIFGVTGNLSTQKLLPALYNLYQSKKLPAKFRLIGFGRRNLSQTEFHDLIQNSLGKQVAIDDQFLDLCEYFEGQITEQASFINLHKRIEAIEDGSPSQRLFHYAVAPEFIATISHNLVTAQLNEHPRLLIEKPFGCDLVSAKELNRLLHKDFEENQIYRLDHYLGKDSVREIATYQQSQPNWDNTNIAAIHVSIHVQDRVENRGGYYDTSGELRDIIQNHTLEMLAQATMDQGQDQRAERKALLDLVHLGNYVTGQYEGYREGSDVAPNSNTETYVSVEAAINSPHWQGVSITLESGKGMKNRHSAVVVSFKDGRTKEFVISASAADYANLLHEAMKGDQTYFVGCEEVETLWRIIEPLLQDLPNKQPLPYKPGSEGPQSNE